MRGAALAAGMGLRMGHAARRMAPGTHAGGLERRMGAWADGAAARGGGAPACEAPPPSPSPPNTSHPNPCPNLHPITQFIWNYQTLMVGMGMIWPEPFCWGATVCDCHCYSFSSRPCCAFRPC
jgi:hypothetical protein